MKRTLMTLFGTLALITSSAAAEKPAAAPPAPAPEAAAAPAPNAGPVVQENMKVGMDYTLTAEGKVVDTSEGKPPFQYVHGKSQIIPGLERQLAGLHIGDTREITVSPEEGYGVVDPNAFMEVPKSQLPPANPPTVGAMLRGTDANGRPFQAIVSEIKPESVILNFNHPLAGKTLVFKIKITDIAPAGP